MIKNIGLKGGKMKRSLLIVISLLLIAGLMGAGMIDKAERQKVIEKLVKKYGEAVRGRAERGVNQVADLWKAEDGSPQDFERFCLTYFIADREELKRTFNRFEENLEVLLGRYHQVQRYLLRPIHLDMGKLLAIDYLFANYNPYAHLAEDLFKLKVAFVALLNFPVRSLEEKLKEGERWSRLDWAEAKLAEIFSSRVPAEVQQKLTQAYVAADNYISNYNIYMHRLLTEDGRRLFPEGKRLISHWGLRDELKALYVEKDGFEKQQMIFKVMQRIIDGTIPSCVINSDRYDWKPYSNKVYLNGKETTCPPEGAGRYAKLLAIFKAEREADPYYPSYPSYIDRKFKVDRQMKEEDVERLLVQVVSSPLLKKVAAIIEKRLGRKLQPFDIWYLGLKPRPSYPEEELDKIVARRFPNVEAFQRSIPEILMKLGFSKEKAEFIASKIVVDPARGAGHAYPPGMRSDKAHLRTRVPKGGMNYKGYNIAMHELGHNVEQVLSLYMVDHYLLRGVPNTAFTEAFAFIFQARDLDVLGLKEKNPMARHMKALDTLWATYEIAGVSLVDMKVWRWMYDHPEASPQQLRQAVMEIAKQIWNRYYAPVFGLKDQTILAIYSHMIDSGLYLPDYPMGHIIAYQLERYMEGKNLAEEMERMCKQGSIAPQLWMKKATGEELSAEALLKAAEEAIEALKE